MKLAFADLFCCAGGTSTGLVQAANDCGISIDVTAVNHWPTAIACMRQGRRFIGVEKDGVHFAMACRRIRHEMAFPGTPYRTKAGL